MDAERLTGAPAERRWAPGVASATLALHEGEPCGDAAVWLPRQGPGDGGCLLGIVDGLGHGAAAACAAEAVLHALQTTPGAAETPLAGLLQHFDTVLSGLRGAAVGLLRVQGDRLWHAAIGNTRAMRLRAGRLTRLPSQNGIVGGGMPVQVTVNELDVQPGDWLLLFTDGLDERLSLPVQLPEWRREPERLCRHLLQHHRQGQDDCGVLAMLAGPA